MADSLTSPRNGNASDIDLPIPPHLKAKLEDFQRRLWSVKIAEGALAGLVGLGLSYLALFAVDRVIDTPGWVRGLLLAIGFATPAIILPLRWHRWVRKQQSLAQIARLLRRRHPRLGDELLGIVELAHSPSHGNSSVLVKAAMAQVDQRIADRDFDDAVPANRYGTWLATALAVLALAGALVIVASTAAENALSRWITPWKAIDRFTFAQLDEVPETIIVPYAEDFDLNPALSETTEWKPNRASLRLPGKTKLGADRDADQYAFEIPPQKENADLKLRVGDEIRKIQVDPKTRPELTALSAVVRLPDYLRYETDPVIPVRGSTISVVEGASAIITGTASRELAEAHANGIATTIDGASFSTAPIEVAEPVAQTLTWSDIHGLRAKDSIELEVRPVEDARPDVFARQTSEERVILESEVITFDLTAVDDFGIRSLGLEWHGQRTPGNKEGASKGEKPVAAGEPEVREIQTKATFSAEREGIPPQTIQLRAFAEDYLPDRPRSYSPTFVLHILAPADHAEWLTQEFGKWFRAAREVYEREQQLYETNRSLRELSPTDLDKPENRRRLQEQASAESSNARRLDSLTRSGRDLVRQAMKNEEFDAERLESWATMMRSLDDIAKQRMPSVADLLQQSSRAAGASPDSGTKPGEKSKKPSGDSPSTPSVANNKGKSGSAADSPESEGKPPAGAPSISDQESSLAENQQENEGKENDPKKPSAGALRLPQTTLGSVGNEEAKPKPESPAQEKLDEAITEQKDLLEEFARVTDELQQILSSLEASTFVKRLKAASRKQTELAKTLNQTLDSGFGLPKNRIEQQLRDVGEEVADTQEEQSGLLYAIQTDLEAYYQRKPQAIFKNVLDQMKALSVVSRVKQIGRESRGNLSGRSIAASEFWADTLDRWAEELVSASECEPCKGGSKDSLPPEIVLSIMQVLQEQMYLRDETREMQSTRPALAPDVYESKVRPLELTQAELRQRVDDVVGDIFVLPDSERQFAKEIQLLNLVSDVMREARAVLSRPDTGPEAIAAQTEAIELLLQSNRQKNQGGGGGGSSPGGGGAAGNNGASLSDLAPAGTDSEIEAIPEAREVEQSTGKAGRELPEEFRRGLDQYFNVLESN